MNWSSAIKKLRNKLQLSQVELAKKLGVSFASVNRWEKGRFEPTIKCKKEIKKLCDKYRIYASFDGNDVFLKCMKRLKNNPLMKRAFVDSSYKNFDHSADKDNTLLATYGDAVLKLAFCEVLFDHEKLSNEKSIYERDSTLVEIIGKRYDILDFMKVDSNDSKMPKDYLWNPNYKNVANKEDTCHKRIATCIEAIIGAIYRIDKDMDEIIDIADCWKNLIDEKIQK